MVGLAEPPRRSHWGRGRTLSANTRRSTPPTDPVARGDRRGPKHAPPFDRRAATVPPAAVLNSWLLEQGHAREHDGILAAVTPLTNRLDDALLAALPTDGGSLNRAQLRAALTAVGYTDASAATLVGRSPVIQRCDHDTYIAR